MGGNRISDLIFSNLVFILIIVIYNLTPKFKSLGRLHFRWRFVMDYIINYMKNIIFVKTIEQLYHRHHKIIFIMLILVYFHLSFICGSHQHQSSCLNHVKQWRKKCYSVFICKNFIFLLLRVLLSDLLLLLLHGKVWKRDSNINVFQNL